MLQYSIADTATFTITNTTSGKEAPTGDGFGNVYPLFDTNLCALTGDKYTGANLGIADDYSGFHFDRTILAKTDGIA